MHHIAVFRIRQSFGRTLAYPDNSKARALCALLQRSTFPVWAIEPARLLGVSLLKVSGEPLTPVDFLTV